MSLIKTALYHYFHLLVFFLAALVSAFPHYASLILSENRLCIYGIKIFGVIGMSREAYLVWRVRALLKKHFAHNVSIVMAADLLSQVRSSLTRFRTVCPADEVIAKVMREEIVPLNQHRETRQKCEYLKVKIDERLAPKGRFLK